jgi:hypothetical protein
VEAGRNITLILYALREAYGIKVRKDTKNSQKWEFFGG